MKSSIQLVGRDFGFHKSFPATESFLLCRNSCNGCGQLAFRKHSHPCLATFGSCLMPLGVLRSSHKVFLIRNDLVISCVRRELVFNVVFREVSKFRREPIPPTLKYPSLSALRRLAHRAPWARRLSGYARKHDGPTFPNFLAFTSPISSGSSGGRSSSWRLAKCCPPCRPLPM